MRKCKKTNESRENLVKQINESRYAICFSKIDEKISELRKLFEEEYNELKEEYEKDVETYEVMLNVQQISIKYYERATEFFIKNNKIYKDAIDYCEKVAKDNGIIIDCRKEIESKQDKLIAQYGELNIQRPVKKDVKKAEDKPVKKNVKKNVKKQSNKPIYALEHIHDLEFEED